MQLLHEIVCRGPRQLMAPPAAPVLAPPSQLTSSFSQMLLLAGQSSPQHETQRHSYTDIACMAHVIAHPLHRATSQSLKAQSERQ
jgi:hypothetical protein